MWFPICVGSIVGPRTIVTAAFCFGEPSTIEKAVLLKQIVIVGGTHYLSPNESVEFILRDIVKEVTHPRYVKGVAAHDISILTVREKFAFDDRVRLTRIRMSDESIQDGSICQVLAWGTQVNFGADIFNIPLRVTTIRVYNHLMCELIFERELSPDQICSERPNLYVQPCSLDIGSPLVCDNVLFGIGSNYWNCSNPKEPNMFTSVSKYIKYVAYTQGNAEFSCASNSSISKLFLIFLGIYPKLFCFN
ncbi:mast cell protease 2-like isoform X2 [Hermetia illucens]|nr:mast cell protease 2-like isoform X2 [Hermetia illucens]